MRADVFVSTSGNFTALLGRTRYVFAKAYALKTTGSYSAQMRMACAKLGMKPVCDHRNYCKNDKNALYIGQAHHIAYPPHRRINNYFPAGFADIRGLWNNLCSYTNNAKGNYALCNVPSNTHAWRSPAQYNPGFMCGAVLSGAPPAFSANLGARNGVPARAYVFQQARANSSSSGTYSDRMRHACSKFGMKPVCEQVGKKKH